MPIAKETGSDFAPAPSGAHIARCFACVSLGTQPSNNPQFAPAFKIMLLWELCNEALEIEGQKVPMTISREYTSSLGSKSNLRKDLESWRGREFTPEELKGFDVAKVVGQPCIVNVLHRTSGKGKTYAAVSSVMRLPKGQTCPPQHHASVVYEIEMKRGSAFSVLPEWIQKKIEQCDEFRARPADAKGPVVQPAEPEPEAPVEDDDAVPF
jgi:hypothetical protein